MQFLQFLEQYAQDTQEYFAHSTQAERQTALKQQVDTIHTILRRFQHLFFKEDVPELPFEEE